MEQFEDGNSSTATAFPVIFDVIEISPRPSVAADLATMLHLFRSPQESRKWSQMTNRLHRECITVINEKLRELGGLCLAR